MFGRVEGGDWRRWRKLWVVGVVFGVWGCGFVVRFVLLEADVVRIFVMVLTGLR